MQIQFPFAFVMKLVLLSLLSSSDATVEQSTLEGMYKRRQVDACDKVKASLPSIPKNSVDSFMQAYHSFNGTGSEDEVFTQARNLLKLSSVETFLSLPDSFSENGLDAALAQCVVLSEATPEALAAFAAQDHAQSEIVDKLLNDTLLQRDMLVSGGARSGKYAEAMNIYMKLEALLEQDKTSSTPAWDDYSQDNILHRFAVSAAVEHAVPRGYRFQEGTIDPIQQFKDYKEAYLNGDLDPNFEMLSTFECRGLTGMVDSSNANLTWMRETQAIFHPDHLVISNLATRYMQAVHTDVPYQHPLWPAERDYTTIPAAGGECGPRAWFGRFARWSFGMPTWGHQQPGHAAMSTWTPAGWTELLGRPWQYSYWENRGGLDFHLETQARAFRSEFQKILRGQWVAKVLNEEPVNARWTPDNPKSYGQGGFWSALMLYAKKITVADQGAAPVRQLQKSVVPTKIEALIADWKKERPIPTVSVDKQGTITIPAAAIAGKKGSISIMPSADSAVGQQVLHGGGGWDVENHVMNYTVSVEKASSYYLVANFSTWHQNLDLFMTSTASPDEVKIPVFWSHGHWMETQPVEIKLTKGENTLSFSRRTALAMAFKEFFLFKSKPVVPTPDPSDVPVPTPPPTPLSDYIIQPNRSSCAKDGLSELDAEHCSIACAYFGYKDTGSRNRPQAWPGCFVLTDGPWKGNCNFNTNKDGDGSDVTQQAVCSRHGFVELI